MDRDWHERCLFARGATDIADFDRRRVVFGNVVRTANTARSGRGCGTPGGRRHARLEGLVRRHAEPTPADFELVLQWRQNAADDNSGVFVRFPDLDSKGYNNTAFVAAHFGYEVQIDNTGHPDGEPRHTTGAIYDMPDQQFSLVTPRAVGEWNEYRIRVVGDLYEVFLNGTQTTRFENHDAERGRGTFIGIQTHTGNVSFREIRLRRLLE